ncbi:MAG: T9SS type A sorting domain-containing protein [Prevotellaceae bacterium]|jgi:hypothetical protein|nr:T9SS type A sorting domain-containing protein [Prevotellaceae bacterium]
MRKTLYLAVAFLLGGIATLFAQQELHLVVNDYNGQIEIPVSQITDITFSPSGDRMTITKTDNSRTVIGENLLSLEEGVWSYAEMSFEMRSTSSVSSTESSTVAVYPNPAADVLYIKGVDSNAKPSVYTADGKAIALSATATADGLQLNIASLPQGAYYISVNNQYVKFIKK